MSTEARIVSFPYKTLYDHFQHDPNTNMFRKQDNSTLAFAVANIPMLTQKLPSEIKAEIIPLSAHFKNNDINKTCEKVTKAYANLIALNKK